MFTVIIIILVVLIVVLIAHGRSRSNSSSGSDFSAEIADVNHEIVAEMNKSQPDYERLKQLHERLNNLKNDSELRQKWQQEMAAQGESWSPTPQASLAPNMSKHSISGIEIALYIGSLLILVGVGGLVISGLDVAGLMLLVFASIAFYVGGIMIRKKESFKTVSHVFVGTGMAMLPFIGILLYNITRIEPAIIWLIMSLISLPVYTYATYIMNNRVFSYASIIGLASFSCSIPATVGLSMMWYFVLLMVIGILMDVLRVTRVSEKLGPMKEAVSTTGEWLPVVAMVASLFAMTSISKIEYLAMLSVVILQLGLNYWHNTSNKLWELLVRAAGFAWVVLLCCAFSDEMRWIGIGMIIGATIELAISFTKMMMTRQPSGETIALESGWVIMTMVSYPVATLMINDLGANPIWAGLLAGLILDTIIMVASRFIFKANEWYYAIVPIGALLPLAIVNTLSIPTAEFIYWVLPMNMGLVFLTEALWWQYKDEQKSDTVLVVSAVVFGVVSLFVKLSWLVTFIICLLLAAALAMRGVAKKRERLAEGAIYLLAASMVSLFLNYAHGLDASLVPFVVAHLVFAGLVTTSLIWERPGAAVGILPGYRPRLTCGATILLVTVGIAALIQNQMWLMIAFMVEAAVLLMCGLVFKLNALWMIGAMGLFMAAMWFTKDIPFIWPVVLGVGLIGAVIGIIIYNDRKNKRK